MKKKIIAALLTVASLVAFPVTTMADESASVVDQNFTWIYLGIGGIAILVLTAWEFYRMRK